MSSQFIIKEEGGPDGPYFQVISTLSGYRSLLETLKVKVESLERLSENDPQFDVPNKILWEQIVVVAGKSEGAYLSFKIDRDLTQYYRVRSWKGRGVEYLFVAVIGLILFLAFFGLISLIKLF